MIQILTETSQKSKNVTKIQDICTKGEGQLKKLDQELISVVNKTRIFKNMCQTFLGNNYQLYLKHEQMLDVEREERKKLAEKFQDEMKGI